MRRGWKQLKKKLFAVFGAILLVCSLPLTGTAAGNQPFRDVPSTKHFAGAVNELAARNIIGGYPDGTFKPGHSITRGQAAAIIAKVIKLDTPDVKNPGFKDISTSHGFYNAIAAMAEKGIIGGYPDGTYKPNDPINRKNMAAILVKAFDLPRDADIQNPFKEIGITSDVLIIYKLGITTGTSPTTFSPNAPITRGQAAKMIKETEEVNTTSVVTLGADDLGWDLIYSAENAGKEAGLPSDVCKPVLIKGKEGYTKDKVQLIPQKEGKGAVILTGQVSGKSLTEYRKYYVHVTEVNGELKLTMKETHDSLPTPVIIDTKESAIQNITLSTMEGKKLTDSAEMHVCSDSDIFNCITVDKPGQYIATVRYAAGDEVRYGIEAQAVDYSFQYETSRVKEIPSAVLEIDEKYDIGKHTTSPKNADEIAAVTRDPGTNVFRVTGKKKGRFEINFEHALFDKEHAESCSDSPGDCGSSYFTGAYVLVEQIGSIVGVYVGKSYMPDH